MLCSFLLFSSLLFSSLLFSSLLFSSLLFSFLLLGERSTSVSDIYLHEVRTLCEDFPSADVPNVRHSGNGGFRPNTYNKIMGEEDFIISDIVRKHHGSGSRLVAYLKHLVI